MRSRGYAPEAARARLLNAPEPASHASRRSRAETASAMDFSMLSHISRSGLPSSHKQPSRSMSIVISLVGANRHPSTRKNASLNSSDAATERCQPERQNTTIGRIGPRSQFLKIYLVLRCASRNQPPHFQCLTIFAMTSRCLPVCCRSASRSENPLASR